jgi:glutamyl-tRNA reductase
MKQAYTEARTLDIAGEQLKAIFTEAFRVAKKIRRETPLGEKSVSMVSLVIDAVTEHVDNHGKSTVAIVGVGPMSVKLADHLKDRSDIDFFFVNRTVAKAEALAAEYSCRAMSLSDFIANPGHVDIVFTSTGAPEPIFNRAQVEHLQAARTSDTPLQMIDLAIPRDVDAAVADIDNVICRDIPYFQATADRNRRARFVAVDQAERIVDSEVGRAHRVNAERQFRPVFSAALSEGLAYAHAGVERLFKSRLGHLSDEDRDAISHFTDKLVRYTNHLPVSALAEQADTSNGSCSMIAGFGCMRTRASETVDSDHPAANRCAKTEGNACIVEGKSSFNCE